MRMRFPLALAALLAAIVAAPVVRAASFSEDFSKPAGPGGVPAGWSFSDVGFTVSPKALNVNPASDKIFAWWSAVPVSKSITITANVTATSITAEDWKIIGIGVGVDGDNYWHLALVESPDSDGKKHYVELTQMKDAQWGNQNPDFSKLTNEVQIPSFDWKPGIAYQFKLTLTPNKIEGTVSEAGVVKFQADSKFSAPAVKTGRPMLDSAGVKGKFDTVTAVTTDAN